MDASHRPLRIVIIGDGHIGLRTAEVLTSLPGVQWVGTIAARDITAEALTNSDADVAAICSASGLHSAHAALALGLGKHVVIEKPLTLDIAGGRRTLALASQAGLTVSVILQRRFDPAVIAAKARIASGELGRLVLAEGRVHWRRDPAYFDASPWRGTTRLDGGVLPNQAIHVLDLMRWLVGPVESVSGLVATRVKEIEAPDTAVASLLFANGALGAVSATVASSASEPFELNLHFEHDTVRLTSDPAEQADRNIGHRRQWAYIIEALHAGAQPEVTGVDGLGTAALVAAIHESAAAGGVPVRPVVA